MRGKTIRRETWEAVKTEYLLARGSCRELAERYGLTESAVASKAKRQRWREQLAQTEQRLASKIETELDRRATSWADMTEAFRHKSADDVRAFLEAVDKERESLRRGDVESLARLISGAWKPLIDAGRKTFDLDEVKPPAKLFAASIRVGVTIDKDSFQAPVVDLEPLDASALSNGEAGEENAT